MIDNVKIGLGLGLLAVFWYFKFANSEDNSPFKNKTP